MIQGEGYDSLFPCVKRAVASFCMCRVSPFHLPSRNGQTQHYEYNSRLGTFGMVIEHPGICQQHSRAGAYTSGILGFWKVTVQPN